ncbi:MAG: 2-hydroxyacid dehydrogenase [Microthrixaceae bacterium]
MLVWLPFDDAERYLGQLPAEVELARWDGKDPLPDRADEVEVLVPPWWPKEAVVRALPQLPRLRLVQMLNAGVDWIADAVPDGVALCNTGDANAVEVAEWALAVTLSHLRELPGFAAAQADGVWRPRATPTLRRTEVVVVGAGAIGRALVRMLGACDARVTLVARTARDGVEPVERLPELVGRARVLVLATALTEGTRGLVDAALLARLPDGALVVNLARGPVVVTDDLVAELRSGRLHAALDVTDPEPLPEGHELWSVPNLVVTPHVGGATENFLPNAFGLVGDQLRRLAAGEEPAFRLDPDQYT